MTFSITKGGAVTATLIALSGICYFPHNPVLGCALGLLLLASLLLHELAHISVARVFGVPVKELGVASLGPFIRRHPAATAGQEALIALAGPLLNLTLSLVTFSFGPVGHWLSLCNLSLFLFNALPLPRSDGRRFLNNIRACSLGVTGRRTS